LFAPSPWILRLEDAVDRSEETMRRRLLALGWTEVREGVWRDGPDPNSARAEGDEGEEVSIKKRTLAGRRGAVIVALLPPFRGLAGGRKGSEYSGEKTGVSTGHKADMAQGHNGKPAAFTEVPKWRLRVFRRFLDMGLAHVNTASTEHDAKTRGIDGAGGGGANKSAGFTSRVATAT
jgi:hypothetical protein